MKKTILIFAVLLSGLTAHAAISPLEGQETHGGSSVLADFWWQHNDITRVLSQCLIAGQDLLASHWVRSNKLTVVETSPQVFLGPDRDQEVVARNSPLASPPVILISETLWPKLNAIEKTKITMHEILPVLGFIDASYQYSAKLYTTYYNCLVPSRSKRELKLSLSFCEVESISRWGAAEISVIGKYAMHSATYFQCVPGILKLQSFGYDLKTCDPDEEGYLIPESPLESFIAGYHATGPQAATALEFFLKAPLDDLRSDCDSNFKKACKTLQKNKYFKDSTRSELAKKLSCH